MKRWQWYTVAVFAGLVALEAYVYAAPTPNNCGVNMLCRVRTLVVSGTTTLTGGLLASSALNKGTVTLDGGGTGAATVLSGAVCTCADTGNANACAASVSGTTLTLVGTALDTLAYTCL